MWAAMPMFRILDMSRGISRIPFAAALRNTKPAGACRGNRLLFRRLPAPEMTRDRPLRVMGASNVAVRSPREASNDSLPARSPTLTMQGFGQHEPLLRLDLHAYSLSGLLYRLYVRMRAKFCCSTRRKNDRRGTLAATLWSSSVLS